ncbi:MAG: E3 ubiquitin ligase family protein [Candidatus Omnitrophica bacterium]|nr:E3 ubiquitin ligase family protein [Candidatus Omnitrophota bacterium]
MENNIDDIIGTAVIFIMGFIFFFYGFMQLRRKRLIEDMPTSTVRGLALGLVELQGVARPSIILRSPITLTECCVYEYKVEQYCEHRKDDKWVTVAYGNSFKVPFYLEDKTGKVKICPEEAEMLWSDRLSYITGGFRKQIPDFLTTFLEKNGIKYRSWLGTKKFRFTERYFLEGEPIYVLGTAVPENEQSLEVDKQCLIQRLEELKSDPQWIKQIDTNQDGYISQEEWDKAVAQIESELLSSAIKDSSLDNASGIKICKANSEEVFIIGTENQHLIIKNFSWDMLKYLLGGPLLSLGALGYILWRLKGMGFFN